jgi:hypothetical protein
MLVIFFQCRSCRSNILYLTEHSFIVMWRHYVLLFPLVPGQCKWSLATVKIEPTNQKLLKGNEATLVTPTKDHFRPRKTWDSFWLLNIFIAVWSNFTRGNMAASIFQGLPKNLYVEANLLTCYMHGRLYTCTCTPTVNTKECWKILEGKAIYRLYRKWNPRNRFWGESAVQQETRSAYCPPCLLYQLFSVKGTVSPDTCASLGP